jgi:hypothetical protein
MARTPIARPDSDGRVFGTDWTIANVATLLRANAARGMWRSSQATGGYTARLNQNYLRTASARHLPTNVTLLFMRLEAENCWYASLCFADGGVYLPWNGEIAEQWLCAIFGADRPRVSGEKITPGEDAAASVRQFRLPQFGE